MNYRWIERGDKGKLKAVFLCLDWNFSLDRLNCFNLWEKGRIGTVLEEDWHPAICKKGMDNRHSYGSKACTSKSDPFPCDSPCSYFTQILQSGIQWNRWLGVLSWMTMEQPRFALTIESTCSSKLCCPNNTKRKALLSVHRKKFSQWANIHQEQLSESHTYWFSATNI